MTSRKRAFITGDSLHGKTPLDRYLPAIPPGMLPELISGEISPGGMVLDPFGSSPTAILEVARAGYRVIVACNNPILAHMLRVLAGAYPKEHFSHLGNFGCYTKGR
jgi:hypothetical protein